MTKMFGWKTRVVFGLVLMMLLAGCAAIYPRPFQGREGRPGPPVRFFKALDQAVEAHQVNDASTHTVFGFPYLSVDRFLAALSPDIKNNEQRSEWLDLLMKSSAASRGKEIQNLPEPEISRLARRFNLTADREALKAHLQESATRLFEFDRNRPGFFEAVQSAAGYPDEYITAYRIFGLYPLVALPVAYLTNRVRADFQTWFTMPIQDLPVTGELIAFAPGARAGRSRGELLKPLKNQKNSLGMPMLSDGQVKELADHFAPVIFQDVSGPHDRPGQVVWKENRVDVDPTQPTVYYYPSYSRYRGETVFQMNYAAWYSDRKGPEAPWIEHGHFDGVTIRMTFLPDGAPYMVDIMNNCGCYHLFVPDRKFVKHPVSKPMALDPFVPQWLPPEFPDRRLAVRVNSGWHQIQRVSTTEPAIESTTYQLLPYRTLETLPHADGRTESIFNARGIGKNSERIEPLLLFSMGIPDVGSMRQRGRHAITLLGRAHFSDPDFIDQNFVFKRE